jgi:hypothetical protein
MKYIITFYLITGALSHALAQGEYEKKRNENRLLGNKILEEHGLKYYDSGSYHIVFDWAKIHAWEIDFASFERSLRETSYRGQKLKMLKEDLSVYSETITVDEIANTIFKNKGGKELRIRDVGRVERLKRTCTGAVSTSNGLFINSRTKSNEPQIFLFVNNSISEFVELKNYIVLDYSPSANEILTSKYDIDPFGDSMSHEIYTYNLNSHQLKRQGDLGWIYGSPKYSKNYDTIFVTVNIKNKDGVGSEAKELPIKVK